MKMMYCDRIWVSALVMLLAGLQVQAVDRTWNGGGTDSNWNTADNWGGTAPVGGDRPIFAGSIQVNPVNNFAVDTSFAGIQFDSAASAFTLSGSRITLGGNIDFSANPASAITQTISLNMLLSADRTITTTANGAITVGGIVSGAYKLTKDGPGTLTLSGTNTYTGATTVSGGTLSLTGSLTGAGNVNTTGGGILEISGALTMAANTYFAVGNGITSTTGTTILNTGANVNLGGNAVLIGGSRPAGAGGTGNGVGTLTINGGTLTVAAASGTGGGADTSSIYLNPYGTVGTSTLNLNGGVLSTARVIADGGGKNSRINFNGGTLQAGLSSTIFVNGTVRLNVRDGGAIIDTQNFNVTISQILSHSNIGGDAAIDGGLTKNGGGTLTLSGANAYTGTTTLTAGTLNLGVAETAGVSGPLGTSAAANPGSIVLSGGTLQYSSVNDNDYSGRFSTAASQQYRVDTNGRNVTWATALTSSGGTLTKSGGTGTLTLSSANTYTGTTTLTAGTLNLGVAETAGVSGPLGTSAAANPGSIVLSGGTLQYSSVNDNDYSGRFSTAASQQYRVDTNGRNVTWATALTSSGGTLTKSGTGTLTLNGNNSYSGTNTVSAGTLKLGNATALGTTAGNTTIATGATLDLNGLTIAELFGTIVGTGVGGNGALINSSSTPASITGDIALGTSAFTLGGDNAITLGRVFGTSFAAVITKIGAGTLTLGGGTDNSYLGLTLSANSGTVIFNKASTTAFHAIGGDSSIGSGSTLQLSGTGDYQIFGAASLTVSSGGVFDLNGKNQNYNALQGNLNLNGTGIGSGGALINNTGTTSTITMGTGSVALQSDSSIGGTGNITIADASPSSASITGTGALTKIGTGTLTLSSANTYTGGTTVTAGTLTIGSGGSLANTAIGVTGTATFTVKPGAGTLNLGNTGTLGAGATLNLASGTTFSMVDGAIGTANLVQENTFAGTALTLSGATLNFDLSGATADKLAVAGTAATASVSGTNTINLTPLAALTAGTYNLITAAGGGLTGTFRFPSGRTTAVGGFGGNNYLLTLNNSDTALTVTVAADSAMTWTGQALGDGANDSNWNNTTSTNWALGATPTGFDTTAAVTFQDINTVTVGNVANSMVTIQAGGVSPSSTLFNNSAVNYTVSNASGSIGIAGSGGLTKTGTGTLTLSGANTYAGTTAIGQGTLHVNTGGTLGATTAELTMGTGSDGVLGTVGNLTLNTSATVGAITIKANTSDTTTPANIGQLSIASGSTLIASGFTAGLAISANAVKTALGTGSTAGAGGSLTVNGNVAIGQAGAATPTSTTVVDLSGLHTFNATSTTGSLSVGLGQRNKGTLTLANNANNITVGTLSVGDSGGNFNYTGSSVLNLGAGTNVIKASTIHIGRAKGGGEIQFAGSGGSVTISGTTGGSSTANISIGVNDNRTYQGGANKLLLAGHDATVNADTVIVSQKAGSGQASAAGGSPISEVTFDTGTFNASSIQMSLASSGDSGTSVTSTFTVGGPTANSAATGVVNITNNLLLSNITGGSSTATGSLIINGGTVNVNTAASTTQGIRDNSTSGNSTTTTLTLQGGTLNLNNGIIGGDGTSGNRAIDNLNFQSGTLQNVAQINNGAGLVKTTSGILTLSGTNTYSGGTIVSNGTLRVNSASALLATGAVTLRADTTLDVAGFSPIATPVTVASLTSSSGLLKVATTDRLQVNGDMTGTFRLTLSDSENLDNKTTYVVAKFTGTPPTSVTLEYVPSPWRVRVISGEVLIAMPEGTRVSFF